MSNRALIRYVDAQIQRMADLRATDHAHSIEYRSLALSQIRASSEALDKRLDLLNELRGDVATRDQLAALDVRFQEVKTRIDKLEASSQGRSGGLKDYIGWIIAALTVVSAFIGFAVMLRK